MTEEPDAGNPHVRLHEIPRIYSDHDLELYRVMDDSLPGALVVEDEVHIAGVYWAKLEIQMTIGTGVLRHFEIWNL